jgi:hypothetical protein
LLGTVCHESVDMSFRPSCSAFAAAMPSSLLSGTRTDFTDHCPAPYEYLATLVEKPRAGGCFRPARKPQLSCQTAADSTSFLSWPR